MIYTSVSYRFNMPLAFLIVLIDHQLGVISFARWALWETAWGLNYAKNNRLESGVCLLIRCRFEAHALINGTPMHL